MDRKFNGGSNHKLDEAFIITNKRMDLERIFAIANGWYALRGQSHPCIICFLYISAKQYIQDEQNF